MSKSSIKKRHIVLENEDRMVLNLLEFDVVLRMFLLCLQAVSLSSRDHCDSISSGKLTPDIFNGTRGHYSKFFPAHLESTVSRLWRNFAPSPSAIPRFSMRTLPRPVAADPVAAVVAAADAAVARASSHPTPALGHTTSHHHNQNRPRVSKYGSTITAADRGGSRAALPPPDITTAANKSRLAHLLTLCSSLLSPEMNLLPEPNNHTTATAPGNAASTSSGMTPTTAVAATDHLVGNNNSSGSSGSNNRVVKGNSSHGAYPEDHPNYLVYKKVIKLQSEFWGKQRFVRIIITIMIKNLKYVNFGIWNWKIQQKNTGRSLDIRPTLKISQGNIGARMVSELNFYISKFSCKIVTKKFDLKIFRNGDPVGLRLNMVKSGQPSSAKCVFHKSFTYTFYICLNCKIYFFPMNVNGMALK